MNGAQRRLGRCVIWAIEPSRATTSALGGELAISVVYFGAKEPRRARNWPIRLVISSWEERLQDEIQDLWTKGAGREIRVPWAGLHVVGRLGTAAAGCGRGQ
eukprot:scaffold130118_cov66-Phaeocystis_antarctica.AAC.3